MAELLHQLNVEPSVIAAQITGFLLLWLVLARFLFRPVLALMRSREEEIKSTYEDAENSRTEAEEFRADYEKRLADIESEARSRIQAAVKEAQDSKNEILADAKSRSDDMLERGRQDLEREREKTLAQLREEVVDISLAAAGKLIGEALDEARHRKLVNDFIDRIGTTK